MSQKDQAERLDKQYCKEILLLKSAIAKRADESECEPVKIITDAVMEISNYRVREKRKTGWVCGTQVAHVSDRLQQWINYYFADNVLEELIRYCKEDEKLDPHWYKILLSLLNHAPRIIVHPRYSQYLED